jgi:hypothetical protein
MKRLSLVVALFALAIPAAASAKGGAGHKSAAKQCKAIRAEMGAEAFRAAFAKQGGKRAMKRCVAAQIKANKAAKRRAKKSCKAEGKRGQALKRCVRSKLEAEPPSAAPEAFKQALEICKDAREEDPDGFAEEYGEGAEALEACVAVQTDEAEDEDSEGDDPVGEEPGESEVADAPDPESELV